MMHAAQGCSVTLKALKHTKDQARSSACPFLDLTSWNYQDNPMINTEVNKVTSETPESNFSHEAIQKLLLTEPYSTLFDFYHGQSQVSGKKDWNIYSGKCPGLHC